MAALISEQYTRDQLGERVQLTGKALTQYIRDGRMNGEVVRHWKHVDPYRSKSRRRVYCLTAKQIDLLEE